MIEDLDNMRDYFEGAAVLNIPISCFLVSPENSDSGKWGMGCG